MSFETTIEREALKQYMHSGIRKRYLVNEGDLFMLYKEVMQVRHKETRKAFKKRFKALLHTAQPVSLTHKTTPHVAK